MPLFCVWFLWIVYVCSFIDEVVSSDIPIDTEDDIALLLKILREHQSSRNTPGAKNATEATSYEHKTRKNSLNHSTCLENEFHCLLEDACIDDLRLCDSGLDCSDGSDEFDCFECQFDFPNGRLIRMDKVCDGVADCHHESPCGNTEFACHDDLDTVCIPDEWKCDSVPDCPGLTDESVQLCGNRSGNCGVDRFECHHGLFCVPATWFCDGEQDCGDNSDEDGCYGDMNRQLYLTNASLFVWGDWSEWSPCSSDCDGERTRSRKCRFGDCVGRRNDVQSCGEIYPCVMESSEGCGTRVFQHPFGRVVGGRDAQLHEWPWQVQIFRPSRTMPFCGGSLIKPNWVLTAAHCFYKRKYDADDYSVAVGRRHTSRRQVDDQEQYVHVGSVIIHDAYDKPSYQNDIALLHLQRKVTVNQGANVVCLPSVDTDWLQDSQERSLECFVTGFGIYKMGRRPTIMQEAKVNLIDREICGKSYVFGVRVTETMICAGHMQGGIDACQGDSGGPLVCQHPEDGRWYQVGITSWGKGCGLPNRPGVYTYVPSFYRWIHRNILDKSDI